MLKTKIHQIVCTRNCQCTILITRQEEVWELLMTFRIDGIYKFIDTNDLSACVSYGLTVKSDK